MSLFGNKDKDEVFKKSKAVTKTKCLEVNLSDGDLVSFVNYTLLENETQIIITDEDGVYTFEKRHITYRCETVEDAE